ncbi:cytochrome b [Sphingomonas sp. LM7]|uniref:cytochrome b n=1 Tax=Sphingomonas sp. LM7 TaxID=1938607 RepID=UPI000983DDA1|nr:cytochrome b [Sphingomonas sp. LM7]AQR74356.1 cytochrome b [Sphingomonas sp. LM7]
MRESEHRYSTVSIVLHWTIAVLLIANILVGGWMEDAQGPDKLSWFATHKSLGITVFVLTLVRLGWRIAHPWPSLPVHMAGWERLLARATHVLFYVVLLAIPLLGWAAASAGGAPTTDWFGLFPVGNLPVPRSEDLGEMLGGAHKLLIKATYILIGLHVLGAIKHQFLNRDGVVHRMLPILPVPRD